MLLNRPRRYLLINPNTTPSTSQRLWDILQKQLPEDVVLQVRTARFGASYIACEASHAVASHACLQAWAEYKQEQPQALDGVLIGCFGDPGLFALREASACPVTGLAEASFILAAQHGPFAIVTGGERWRPMLQRLAQVLGYGSLLRHIETVAPSGSALQADPEMAIRLLSQACTNAAAKGVNCIILGGAGLAGYAEVLRPRSALPFIDSAEAGLQVMLKGLAPRPQYGSDGFFAQWQNMTPEMISTPVRE